MQKKIAVFQSFSHVWLFAAPWNAARQTSLSFTVSWSLLKFTSVESVMLSNHLILCCPLLLLPSICPSIKVFSSESALCIRWPKYWSLGVSILGALWLTMWTLVLTLHLFCYIDRDLEDKIMFVFQSQLPSPWWTHSRNSRIALKEMCMWMKEGYLSWVGVPTNSSLLQALGCWQLLSFSL